MKNTCKRETGETEQRYDIGSNGWPHAVEFLLEDEEDGMDRLCSPFILPEKESHMQTEQATSGTLVYISIPLSQDPRSHKSPCLHEPCSILSPASTVSSISIYSQWHRPQYLGIEVHLSPACYKTQRRIKCPHWYQLSKQKLFERYSSSSKGKVNE